MTRGAPLVYLDTNVFIRAFEGAATDARPLIPLFLWLRDHPGAAVTSELTWAELLAPTKREGALPWDRKRKIYHDLLVAGRYIPLIPVTFELLEDTANLRIAHAHKLPDAIHIATALGSGCAYFLSSDSDASRLPATLRRLNTDEAGVAALMKALNA